MNPDFYAVDGHASTQTKTNFVTEIVIDHLDEFKSKRSIFPIYLSISGYDEDPRALFQIPEVRLWCRHLYQNIPSIFLFLHPDTINWFFLCIADIKVVQVTERKPGGIFGEYLMNLNLEEQINLKKKRPSSFLKADIKFAPGSENLINEIWNNALNDLQKIASTQEEFDRLTNEFESRLKQGLPRPINME